MKKKIIYSLLAAVMVAALVTGCEKKNQASLEEQVAQALSEDGGREKEAIPEGSNGADGENAGDGNEGSGVGDAQVSDDSEMLDGGASDTVGDTTGKSGKEPKVSGKAVYVENPFLGDTSKATSFNIKFTIQMDCGIAGFTWGAMDDTRDEYYLWAFECTRDFPRLYTSRRKGEDAWDEEYTNLDFMYPEMKMFTDGKHYIEIVVDGNKVTTYLDSYKVTDTTIAQAKPIGQIGTWVMEGDYHAHIDDLFIAEGIKGDGDYIASEDFAKPTSIFSPYLKDENGELYAKAGYYTVMKKSDVATRISKK